MLDGEIVVRGNLTKDVELKFGQSGTAWATFSLAVNKRNFNSKTQESTEKVKFYNCKVFGQQAENLAASVTKGMRIVVAGQLQDDTWTTNEGENRKTEVLMVEEVAGSFRFATARMERNPSSGNPGNYQDRSASRPSASSTPADSFGSFNLEDDPFGAEAPPF